MSSTPTKTTTVGEAKEWLRKKVDDGEHCPVCTQFAKVYKRTIHSSMARLLVIAYKENLNEWFHMPDLTKRIGRGDEGKLRYWELLEEETDRRPDGGRSGWWRVTWKGAAFVRGELNVPKYARIYDSRCLGLEGEGISIRDALGKKFNYDELMNR